MTPKQYQTTIDQLTNNLSEKFKGLDRETTDLFEAIITTAEINLRWVVLEKKKELSKEDFNIWLQKVSLAILAYSICYWLGLL